MQNTLSLTNTKISITDTPISLHKCMVFHTLGAENYFLLTFEIESTNKKQGRDDVAVWFFFKC